jgi:diacylglycerol kinase (ATP)
MVRTFFRSRIRSFKHAFAGVWYVIRTQKNAWIHFTIMSIVVVLAAWLGLSRFDWAVLVVTIGIVWLAEFLNTSIEAIVDLVSPQRHPLAKVSKDVGAAAVLITAATSVIVGILLLGPPLWVRMQVLLMPKR